MDVYGIYEPFYPSVNSPDWFIVFFTASTDSLEVY